REIILSHRGSSDLGLRQTTCEAAVLDPYMMLIGIDIGGTSTKIGLVDNGRVSAAIRIPTTGHADAFAFADALAAEVQRLGADRIQAIGIGAPNANQLTGIIERAPNLPWKEDVPLARMVQERTG